jgi:ACS family hexuronate transporter-like MFS transporter
MKDIKFSNYRWTICALLFFATTINYLDRQVLSLLQPTLAKEFGWNNSDYGTIVGVFSLAYAFSMLFAGRVVDYLGTKMGYTWSIVLWSFGAMLHAVAHLIPGKLLGFSLGRTVLAAGESGNFPAAIKATAEYFPKKDRALATGIFNSGSNVGAILAPIVVPWIAELYGWKWAFILIGALGFVWLIFWLIFYELPSKNKKLGQAEYEYIHRDEILSNEGIVVETEDEGKKFTYAECFKFKQTWAFAFGKFMTDGVWWFFLFWLPAYFKAQYGMTGTDISLPIAVLYTATMFGSIGGGAFPTYFINRGYDPYAGRMRAMFIIALFPLVVLLTPYLSQFSYWYAVLLIGIGASAHQAWSANIFTTVGDMFPKKAIATITGIGGMAGGIGSFLLSKGAGMLFDFYDKQGRIQTGYSIMFVVCALAYVIAWVVMKTLVPKMKPIEL